MSQNPIPFVDLAAQSAEIADEVSAGFRETIATAAFISGPAVREFETAYAQFAGVRHCIGVSNGTDALELGLRAAGVGAGDEVIVPANSFVATAAAVLRAGARPIFVDCDPRTYLIDADRVEEAITSRTRAVVPVHLYGQMAPMAELAEVVGTGDRIAIVEDAAQAQGAKQDGHDAGTLGVVAGTSFYPGKNLGAYGDAGAVLTNDDAVADVVRKLRDHGSVVKYEHEIAGWNCRMDTLQAVVLGAKLRRLADWNVARRSAAARYDELLSDLVDVVRPVTVPGNEHVWHLYVVRIPERDRVLAELQSSGIGVGIHYPIPIHLQRAFSEAGDGPGSLPVAERIASEILSLPMHPHLSADQQERVVETVRASLGSRARL